MNKYQTQAVLGFMAQIRLAMQSIEQIILLEEGGSLGGGAPVKTPEQPPQPGADLAEDEEDTISNLFQREREQQAKVDGTLRQLWAKESSVIQPRASLPEDFGQRQQVDE